jgi:uncharacterized protein
MTFSMYTASAPVFRKMLRNARSWMDKANHHAQQKGYDVNVLVHARLAPDMFPLSRQIQSSCDHAKNALARLAGVDPVKFDDNETTIAELQARIDKCVALVDTFIPAQLDGSETREIVFASKRGERRFIGEDFLRFYALPQFYFHVTTAYAILRHNGVDVGKQDYLNGAPD